jgi:peptidoglycan hydrolase CwlO-like protein
MLQKLYTSIFGKINTADADINTFNINTKNIQNEIADFQKVIAGIESLIPIYKEKSRWSQNKNTSQPK